MATVAAVWTNPAGATLDKTTGNIVDETMTDAWSGNDYFLGGTQGYIGSRAYNNANISIANGTIVTVTLNSGRFEHDPNGVIHSTTVNTSRMTCRTAGVYHMGASIEWAANAVGVRVMYIQKNGTEIIGYNVAMPLTNGDPHRMMVSTIDSMAATDYIELLVYQTSGGALNVVSSGAFSPHLYVLKA